MLPFMAQGAVMRIENLYTSMHCLQENTDPPSALHRGGSAQPSSSGERENITFSHNPDVSVLEERLNSH
jgi:hypothetical protein